MKKYLTVLFLAIVWAAFYIAVAKANHVVSPFVTGMLVRLITLVILTLVMLFDKTILQLFKVKPVLPVLILIGVLGFALDFTSFIGFRHGSASVGTILLKTDVIMISLMSIIIYKEKFTLKDWALTLTMLLGVVLVLKINLFQLQFSPTDLFFILSAFFVSCNAFIIKWVQNQKKVPVLNNVIAYYNNLITLITFTILSFISGDVAQVSNILNTTSLSIVFLIAGFGQFSIYYFYYKSLRELPVWIVKAILLLIPILTLIFDVIQSQNVPEYSQLIGTVIVLGSAAGILLEHERKKSLPELNESKNIPSK